MNLTFPKLLHFHRSRIGLSQANVASLLHMPLRTYWAWEAGVNVPNKITQQVAVATLENLRTDLIPTKAKQGRASNREVIVLQPEGGMAYALGLHWFKERSGEIEDPSNC